MIEDLNLQIIDSIKKAQNQNIFFEELYNDPNIEIGKNEFLFFIKPEILLKSEKIRLDKILDLIERKIRDFGFNIHNIKILSANYLDQYNIIAQHYGIINELSSNAIAYMSEGAKDKFKEYYGKPVNEAKTLGSFEFITQYPNADAVSLDYLWQNIEVRKLASGTYCGKAKIDHEIIYIINGFHPRQLKQYTEAGRSILVMTLSNNISWTKARREFIGVTNPFNAKEGSLRKELLDNKDLLGLQEVSQDFNGAHLSAGPIEALIELKRFNSNFADNNIKDFVDFPFGKILKENLNEHFDDILNNKNVIIEGKQISIFDLTEEKDSDKVIELLETIIFEEKTGN